jgi:hypothetical protein
MQIQHLQHKHGGRIVSIDAIAHETYQRRASWHFVGKVQWTDGSESEAAQIAPYALCYDHDNAEAAAECNSALGRLNDYLARNGKWVEGREWKPAAKKGSEALS